MKRSAYLDALAKGLRRGKAAEAAGIHRSVVSRYRKAHPRFAEIESEAELAACEHVEDALFEAAKSGNITACIFFLCNRMAARWRPVNNVPVAGGGAGPRRVVLDFGAEAGREQITDSHR
jgi:hypothetical protein